MNLEKNKSTIPFNIKFKIIFTGMALIWESIVKYLFFLIGIILLFICLCLLNFFSSLPFWIHILTLFLFIIVFCFILLKLFLSLKWPGKIDCVRRLEIDNSVENRALSTLFDAPILNEHNVIWKEHYDRMLYKAKQIGYFRKKPVLHNSDPLSIRFPFILITGLLIFNYGENFVSKVEAALTPNIPRATSANSVFTGWISPPKYTKLPPIEISENEEHIKSPEGSILTARIYGGKGKSLLIINKLEQEFTMIDKDNFAIESMLNEGGNFIIKQNNQVIFNKTISIVTDQQPKVQLMQAPEKTVKGVLKLAYLLQDDYGVTNLYANIELKDNYQNVAAEALNFSVPFDERVKGSQFVEYYHDLTEHIWAGLPVRFSLYAEDFIGNKAKSEDYEILLPEKKFNNPLALAIVNERKNIGLQLLNFEEVISNINRIKKNEEIVKNYPLVQIWLSEVTDLLLDFSKFSNAGVKKQNKSLAIDKLWKAALFIESGKLAKAEEDLRRAQENLKEALSQSNDASEVQEGITNLEEALGKYLDEIENPKNVDAPQVSESEDPGDRGGENGAQTNEREELEDKLEDIADLAVSGSLDEAQKQLESMQDITEALDRDALGEALGEQEGDSQPMAMQQISEMIEQQEALMEDAFDQSMNAAQADQKTPGSGPVNAGKEQETLRKQLKEVMKEIAESDNPIPEELGRADRAMRQASRELNRNRPDRAQSAQGKAIEELSKAAETMDKMHSSDGPSQMAGNNDKNRSRDRRDPLGRVPPGQGSSPGGDVGLPNERDITKARKIAKQLYLKAEKSLEGTVERRYVDSLLDWY